MANELRLSLSASFNKDPVVYKPTPFSASIDVTGNDYSSNTQTIGTSVETLSKGEISTIGFIMLKNLDETNFIELSADGGATYFGNIRPGAFAVLPVSATNLSARANTASCVCQFTMFEL